MAEIVRARKWGVKRKRDLRVGNFQWHFVVLEFEGEKE